MLLAILTVLLLLVGCSPSDVEEQYKTPISEELFASSELIIPCNNSFTLSQSGNLAGACTYDGILYYALSDGDGQAQICRRSLADDETKIGAMLPLGEAISMCYDSAKNQLIVAHGNTTVSTVDPKTLEVVSTATTDYAIIAITYYAVDNVYLVRVPGKNALMRLDPSFRLQRMTALPKGMESLSFGDITCDGRYLYLLLKDQTSADGSLCAGLVMYDPTTESFYRNVLDHPLNRDKVTSLSISGSVFVMGLHGITGNDSFVMGSPVLAQGEATIPADLLSRSVYEGASTTGISAEFLFNVYDVGAPLGSNTVLQGGCTDGKYGYFCMEDQAGNYEDTSLHRTCIVKVDMATGELVDVSERLELDHSNDMCYNSRTGQLMVVHCGKGDASRKVSFVDPETLEITGSAMLPIGFYCMAYDEVNDRYMVGNNGRNFAILDSDFNVLTSKVDVGPADYCKEQNLITQGSDCDSEYVYVVLGGHNNGGPWTNYLVVYDWSGNLITVKIIPNMTAESENIFHIGTSIYVGCNGGADPVYRIDISK